MFTVGDMVDGFSLCIEKQLTLKSYAMLHLGWGMFHIRIREGPLKTKCPEPKDNSFSLSWELELPPEPTLHEIYTLWADDSLTRFQILTANRSGRWVVNFTLGVVTLSLHHHFGDSPQQAHLRRAEAAKQYVSKNVEPGVAAGEVQLLPLPCRIPPGFEKQMEHVFGEIRKMQEAGNKASQENQKLRDRMKALEELVRWLTVDHSELNDFCVEMNAGLSGFARDRSGTLEEVLEMLKSGMSKGGTPQ